MKLSDCKKLKFHLQIFTIHGYYKGRFVPLVFLLLPDKKTDTYATALRFVVKRCEYLGLKFQPKEVFLDFEEGIHKAAR